MRRLARTLMTAAIATATFLARIGVRCFDANGQPKDIRFSLSYLH